MVGIKNQIRNSDNGESNNEYQIVQSSGTTISLGFDRNEVREAIDLFCLFEMVDFRNEVYFPRPSHGRIPNFRSCEFAAENVIGLDCFKRARVVKINPSLAQESLRYYTLFYNKILLTPTPALGKSSIHS